MLLQQPAGSTNVPETWFQTVSSPAPTANRETNTANICATATGCLFITDKSTKQRFLIDTGSDLCVFPRKLIPQRRQWVNYDLGGANITTIQTYGSLPLSLNLGLLWEFTWRYVVAHVTTPHRGRLPLLVMPLRGL
jgi:hypothetical protein